MLSELIGKLPELPGGLTYRIGDVPETLPKNIAAHVFEGNFDSSLPDFLIEGPGLLGYLSTREGLKEAILRGWNAKHPADGLFSRVLPPNGDGEDVVDLARSALALRAAMRLPDVPEGADAALDRTEKAFYRKLAEVSRDFPDSSYGADSMLGMGLERACVEGRNDRTRKYLIDNGLMNPGNGLFTGAAELAAFGRVAKSLAVERDSEKFTAFVIAGEKARAAFGDFMKASERTRNGLTVMADLLKEDCVREFGSETPAAYRQLENGRWLLVHRNELKNGESASDTLNRAAAIIASAGQKSWLSIFNRAGKKVRDIGLVASERDAEKAGERIKAMFASKVSQKMKKN